MLTVGCSEGNDATAWHTRIMNPGMKGFLQGQPAYEAIECECAEAGAIRRRPVHDRRLYRGRLQLRRAAGQSRALRHPTVDLRDPGSQQPRRAVRPGRRRAGHAAGRRPSPVSVAAPGRADAVARSQSPDSDEPDRRRAGAESGDVLLPHHSLLGIKDPVALDDAPCALRGFRHHACASPGIRPTPLRPARNHRSRLTGKPPPPSRRARPRVRPRRPKRTPSRRPTRDPVGGRSTRRRPARIPGRANSVGSPEDQVGCSASTAPGVRIGLAEHLAKKR